jgi:hypothetical protein
MTTEHCCFDKKCTSRNKNSEKTLILIRWDDASYQEGPYYIGNLKYGVILETAGHLVQENETHYSVAMDFYEEEGTWRHVTHIPKGMVVSVHKFPVPEAVLDITV